MAIFSYRKDNFIARWFFRLTMPSKHLIATGLMAIFVVVATVTIWLGMTTLGGLRAYATGESTWSKAQKKAVNHLIQYVYTMDEQEYYGYLREIEVTLGDKQARIELEKSRPDFDVVREGFLRGRNSEDDVDKLIFVFRRFRGLPAIEDAIGIWREADAEVERLNELALQIHTAIENAPGRSRAEQPIGLLAQTIPILEEVQEVDKRLTDLEEAFSFSIADAARQLSGILLRVSLVFFILFGFGAVVIISLVNRALLRIDRAKSEFVSLASHQLRTPLTIIGWYSEKLLKSGESLPAEYRSKLLEEIHYAFVRMERLIRMLLNMSRIELGTLDSTKERVDVRELTKRVMHTVAPTIKKNKLNCRMRFGGSLGSVFTNSQLLEIILQNLVVNAVSYTQPGGKVSVSISNHDRCLYMVVRDTGIGIAEADQKKIFEKKYRAQDTQSYSPGGSGLGLYLVQEVVEQLGGTIELKSAKFRGTTFRVTIPIE